VKHSLLLIISFLLLSSPVFGQSDEKCYVVVESSKNIDPSLLSRISISFISRFLRNVESIPLTGISVDSCQYKVSVSKKDVTTFVTFNGEGLNSYGDSRLSGVDGFRQSLLKSLFIILPEKRDLLCEEEGYFLEKCIKDKVQTKQKINNDLKVNPITSKMIMSKSLPTKNNFASETKSLLDFKSIISKNKIRGLMGYRNSKNNEFKNISIQYLMQKVGVGISYFDFASISSSGNKYNLNNKSIDASLNFDYNYPFSYGNNFINSFSYSIGAGIMFDGYAHSSTLNLESNNVVGFRGIFVLGINLGEFEFLTGYHYVNLQYPEFTSSRFLYIKGGMIVFGIGKIY
jgi:hypothetical protein